MRSALPMAFLATILSVSVADAGLQTGSMDAVLAEVTARDAALEGNLTRAEKKLKKIYGKALAKFGKESTSRAKDAKRIRQIVGLLSGRQLRDDAALQSLLAAGVDAFLGEMNGALVQIRRGNAVVGESNRWDAKAEKFLGKADEKIAAGLGEPTLKKKLRVCLQAEGLTTKSRTYLDRALEIEPDLTAHEGMFLRDRPEGYTNTADCLTCHADVGARMLQSGHWTWNGVASNIEGHETHVHGKTDLINNFCIAIGSNEPRCTQCHVGYGWKDKGFDFADATAIDCFVCHDTTGTYQKNLTTAGTPMPGIDLTAVALNVGSPGRDNCMACHATAGGGDNVKHGDLAGALATTTRQFDVHLGTDGGNFACQRCHVSSDHKIAGQSLHSQDEGTIACTDCHTGAVHGSILDQHTARVACQTCHIPAFSRTTPTKTRWNWGDAGQNVSPIPVDQFGKPLYDKKKGTFTWDMNVRPELRWFNGKWNRMVIGENDTYTTTPVVLANPVGSRADPNAKIYPFKLMVGNQPADAVNRRMIVPHLFGTTAGPNPYWGKFDWNLALAEGAAWVGQPYSGSFTFVETEMYMSVNHEIAPKAAALSCNDCHNGGIDFTRLGYAGDPILGGM